MNSVEVSSICKDCGLIDYISVEILLSISKDSTDATAYVSDPHVCESAPEQPGSVEDD